MLGESHIKKIKSNIIEFPKMGMRLIGSLAIPETCVGFEVYKKGNRFYYRTTLNFWINAKGEKEQRRCDGDNNLTWDLDEDVKMAVSYEPTYENLFLSFVVSHGFIKSEDIRDVVLYYMSFPDLTNEVKKMKKIVWLSEEERKKYK